MPSGGSRCNAWAWWLRQERGGRREPGTDCAHTCSSVELLAPRVVSLGTSSCQMDRDMFKVSRYSEAV